MLIPTNLPGLDHALGGGLSVGITHIRAPGHLHNVVTELLQHEMGASALLLRENRPWADDLKKHLESNTSIVYLAEKRPMPDPALVQLVAEQFERPVTFVVVQPTDSDWVKAAATSIVVERSTHWVVRNSAGSVGPVHPWKVPRAPVSSAQVDRLTDALMRHPDLTLQVLQKLKLASAWIPGVIGSYTRWAGHLVVSRVWPQDGRWQTQIRDKCFSSKEEAMRESDKALLDQGWILTDVADLNPEVPMGPVDRRF